jgi:mono/diheme cytochrome c family protein
MREGSRKPYTIRGWMYANAIRPEQVPKLRQVGSVTHDPFPVANESSYPNPQLVLGAKVYRFQCGVCHTMHGANALTDLAGGWGLEQRRLNIAQLQRTKPFMPPFSGTAAELEGLVQLLAWEDAGRPVQWPESHDPAVLATIQRWLDEAGTKDGLRTPIVARP